MRKLQRERDLLSYALNRPTPDTIDFVMKEIPIPLWRFENPDDRQVKVIDLIILRRESDEAIARLITDRLVRKAEAYIIPLPDLNNEDLWAESKDERRRRLTPNGISQLQTAIREHERFERERIGFWVSTAIGVAGTFIGVVGILIAYASLR